MDFEDMNKRACKGELPIDGLMPSERVAWLTLSFLYALVKTKSITREEAIERKQRAMKDFENDKNLEHEYLIGSTAYKVFKRSTSKVVKKVLEELES